MALAAAFVLLAYFLVLVAVGLVVFTLVAGLGTFILVAMLTMPKSDFDVFLSSWTKALLLAWNTFEKIDINTILAAEFS